MSSTARRTPTTSHKSSSSESHGSMVNGRTTPQGNTTTGLGRSPSTRSQGHVSARAAARRPGRSNLSISSPRSVPNPEDDDARAETAATIEDLKQQISKAESVSEQYLKQLGVMQLKLDEATSEQSRLEEQVHEKDGSLSALSNNINELTRQCRDLSQSREAENAALAEEREQQTKREEELQSTIQRLKETIAQRELRANTDSEGNLSRSPSFRNRSSQDLNEQFAPYAQIHRSPSRNNAQLILQKDRLIESLRLELAEAHVKLVEMENMGDGKLQELEKELLEARMTNARLLEDNESFHLLLSEKTLNGEFGKSDIMHESRLSSGGQGSLADELEQADHVVGSEKYRRMENELKSLEDEKQALKRYIECIIGRLLQREGFEHILDKNEYEPPPANPPPQAPPPSHKAEKEMPPPVPAKDKLVENSGASFLQRARSVVVGGQAARPRPKPRPASQFIAPAPKETEEVSEQAAANEHPETAPSIPINRARPMHRRARSEMPDPSAATLVGQLYRSSSPISPSLGSGAQSPLFSGQGLASGRGGAGSSIRGSDRVVSGTASVTSDRTGEHSTEGTSSPPLSASGMTNYTGAVMTQNRLRPLRLVQERKETEEEEAARKKANRASWISWFSRPKDTETASQ